MLRYENFNLKNHNSYKLDAVCRVAYFLENEDDIKQVYENEDNVIVIGSGHNIILTKTYYTEAFIIMEKTFSSITFSSKTTILVNAGMFTKDLSLIALEKSLCGLEVFYDIPSSLGGAIVMNAGASGEEIGNIVTKVRCFDIVTREFKDFDNVLCGFEYRNSYFQKNKNLVVLSVELNLRVGDRDEILSKMEFIKEQRHAKQPKEYPNAGSVFKRPSGRFVGPMLDELNLKGFTVGGAQISRKHSGFIVNVGNATGKDILTLIEEVQAKVKAHFDVSLEVEQRII